MPVPILHNKDSKLAVIKQNPYTKTANANQRFKLYTDKAKPR
jgi:hypothetical protein